MTTPPHELMNVVVRERQQGKTTALVDWLLAPEGGPLLKTRGTHRYPYWKRVIITLHGERERVRLQRVIGEKFMRICDERGWFLEDFDHAISAVWTLESIHNNKHHGRSHAYEDVEFAVDDLDYLIDRQVSNFIGRRPSLVTMNGLVQP